MKIVNDKKFFFVLSSRVMMKENWSTNIATFSRINFKMNNVWTRIYTET